MTAFSDDAADWAITQGDLDLYKTDVRRLGERIDFPAHELVIPLGLFRSYCRVVTPTAIRDFFGFAAPFMRPLLLRAHNTEPSQRCRHCVASVEALYRRWAWYGAQLAAATLGMPQPERRRMTLAQLAPEVRQKIVLPVFVTRGEVQVLGQPEDLPEPGG